MNLYVKSTAFNVDEYLRAGAERRKRLLGKVVKEEPKPVKKPTFSFSAPKPKAPVAVVKDPNASEARISASAKMRALRQQYEDRLIELKERSEEAERLERENEQLRGALGDQAIMTITPKKPVHEIISEVLANFPQVTLKQIRGCQRTKAIVYPRHLIMYELYIQRPDMSLPAIGRVLGKDHTSCLFGIRKIAAILGDKDAQKYVARKGISVKKARETFNAKKFEAKLRASEVWA